MAYLTKDEYKTFHFEEVADDQFDKLEVRAEMSINRYISSYAAEKNLEDLPQAQQVKIKLATALMIDDIAVTGQLRQSERSNGVQSQSIGHTTVNYGSNRKQEALPADALNALRGTGLLVRGVPYVR
ncbi:hypothetical protein ACUIJP_04575 [Leuconostoc pseudomesenteroides]|uniref:hypothetical protein n=1 Tax=Leuconostoc pseudomesenteroides TaxID=33968 RepID=UPI00403D5EEF